LLKDQMISTFALRPDEIISRMRQRTDTRVTCKLGKKTTILQQGDWLFRTSSGWRTIQNMEEFEKCLRYEMPGEILTFDRIEKTSKGSIFLGTLFNPLRSEKKKVQFSLQSEKREGKK